MPDFYIEGDIGKNVGDSYSYGDSGASKILMAIWGSLECESMSFSPLNIAIFFAWELQFMVT